jgi:hypothetical protein
MFAVLGVVVAFTISAVFAQPAQAAATSTTLVNYLGDKMLWMLGKVGRHLHPLDTTIAHVY